jgi:hypothetical protein
LKPFSERKVPFTARDFRILLVQKKMFFLNSACMPLIERE